MYKVLLVDDERMILDGISAIMNWESLGTVLAGTARNGIEAYDRIVQDPPDIIISDIKMPGMDGLQLAEKVHEFYPEVRIILLSGFGEFDYARNAMQFGVKHYLLKPCNELKIAEAIEDLVQDLQKEASKEQFVTNMKQGLDKVLPYVKEQFLKEFVTNKTYGTRDWDYYRKLFNFDFEDRMVRLILFQLEGDFEFEHMFAIKNIAEDILGRPLLSTTIGDHVLILTEDMDEPDLLHEHIVAIRTTFFTYYKIDITIAMSQADEITNARKLYKETIECLNYRFYLGEGSIITSSDINLLSEDHNNEYSFDEEYLCMSVNSGHLDEATKAIENFFAEVAFLRLDIQMTKSYVIQLYVAMIRVCGSAQMPSYLSQVSALVEMDTLQNLRVKFESIANEITIHNFNRTQSKHSGMIQKVLDTIDLHVSNPELSLNWIANELLYMNPDYLGKLFKKEMKEKFSSYVMKFRIEKAMAYIDQTADFRIFELAERFGFGDNPQYFSQVFKKHTGSTPSEYKKN